MNYTFNNSSIVSVNSGTIVLNVSGKTRTFVDAKLVSAVDGKIVLDLPECSYTEGTYAVLDTGLILIIRIKLESLHGVSYHVSQTTTQSNLYYNDYWTSCHFYRNATPEEIQELNNQLAEEGKCWNPDTMQIEKLRWKPIKGQRYYYVALEATPYISSHIWRNDAIDDSHYQFKNCFKTEEEAQVVAKKIKELLLEV